ncbi:hypothetical protein LCGC14_1599650, partial [marine sediment metagenome]
NIVKAESKHYNIYLDISLNDDLLAERVVNDLIRTIQFSRKKDKFKVGEIIKLSITTNKEYLKKYIEQNKMVISDKVTASNFKLNHDQFSKEVEGTFKRLNLCPNKNCSASLKDNIILKLKNKAEIKCPYCSSVLKMDKINNIDFSFSRID